MKPRLPLVFSFIKHRHKITHKKKHCTTNVEARKLFPNATAVLPSVNGYLLVLKPHFFSVCASYKSLIFETRNWTEIWNCRCMKRSLLIAGLLFLKFCSSNREMHVAFDADAHLNTCFALIKKNSSQLHSVTREVTVLCMYYSVLKSLTFIFI